MDERSLILHDLPDDFDRVKSKLDLHFKNKRRSGGEVLQIREHPDDKRKARLIYVTEEDMKKVLDKRIHKLDFKTHGSVEVTVKLPEDKKMKPELLPKPKLEKVGKVLRGSHTQVCPSSNPTTTRHKDNDGDCEISDLLITTPHTVDKEMLQMYCERFTEHFVLQKNGNNSWILKLSNQSDLQKILGQDKQELDISIEVYKEGKWDPRRFILTGFEGSTEWMKISLFIGSCSKTTEHDWEILDEERIVVTFRQDIDVTSFINKCTSKALQGREIGITRLEPTDSVLVQGDLGKISEEALNLHFNNTMRSSGGDIKSLIWINRQKSLLITFQESDVAHEVVEQKHSVCGTVVKASLFYSSLGKALTGEKPTLTDIPTSINISVHEDLLRFIENNDLCRNALEKVVKPLHADILIDRREEASVIRLEMDVDKTTLTALQIGATWETKTERKVQTFLSKYHTAELNVQKDVWQRVRSDCTSLSTGDAVVSFRESSSKIMIAGVKEEVVVLSEKIKRLLDIAAVEMEIQRNTVDAIIQLDCGEKCELLKERVQSKLGQVALLHDENQHKFHLRGLKDQVASVELLIEQVNENIILHHLKLSSHLIHFLQSLDLHKLEQDHFYSNHIPAKFSKQKDLVGIFVEKDNLKIAEDKICEILREDIIQLSPNRTDENWRTFLMKLQDEVESSQNAHNIRVTQTDVQLTLCGFSDVVAEVARKVRGYLEHKKPITEDVPLKSAREVEFVDSCLNLSELPEIKRLGATILACRTTTCPCLKVTAAKDNVKEAVSVIEKQLLATLVERHKYCKAGEAKVLYKHEASVKAKAKEFHCNLYLSQEPVNHPHPSQSFTHKLSNFITLVITRAEWYHQSADALICPMNGSLVFDNPVAKQILQFGGDQIAEVCKSTRGKNSLLPGDVLLCDAGHLNTKSLIFAVLPHKGQALDSRYLQSAIHNALLKAEEQHCTSILVPAVACEIFGFSVRESWTALREAILQFCADHQNSPRNMRDVHIVHSVRKTVDEYNTVIQELGFPDTSDVQSQRKHQGTRALINGVPIYLKKSDITKETVDVIVNSNNIHLNLNTGVSGAILKAAGKSVASECTKQAPLKAGGVVMTSGGDLKCRHIAQMVGPEGPADITSSLGKVLSLCEDKMARTLAIPAIGTGKGAIGPKESIEAILAALKKHLTELNSSCLKEITIVTFEQKILDAYGKHFSEWNKASNRRAQPAYGRMPENQVKIGSVRIELKKGDITNETVRGIVNSTNREMTLMGGVSGAIFKSAGVSVEQECQKHGPLQNDIPAVTSGGNLQCDVIIHVTGPHSASETRSRVKKVLERCEDKQITTISFPAVGTGGGGVKSVDAIQAMLKGFEDHLAQNSSTVIKLIYLVTDRDDVLQEFQKGLKAWTANTQNSEEEDDEDQSEREDSDDSVDEDSTSSDFEPDTTNPVEAIIGPMRVKVTCGDITKETMDAIVNSTTTSLDLNTGVSGAILKAAGQTVVNECKTKAPQPNGGVVLTKAGNLTDIRNIIHMVGQTNVKGITTSMFKVLKTCEENHIQSVSFPALGTGAGNLAATQVANAMTEALADFVKESPQHLKRVHIVIFQSNMLPDFQDAIKKLKKISSSASKTKVPTDPCVLQSPAAATILSGQANGLLVIPRYGCGDLWDLFRQCCQGEKISR
ncbi:protein mono-ADP-ribosyltransferase PARP14-like [Triplophysa dalaica]|uniref:protein mono-ADP-ribosyltransferase PARP14-like n=1 Tax=Triplophysa dalaica TaxID=1582913 RepID=UPI0024E03CC4|nr:protein mono-ADP-ribosyltransferase PARP14-like [Triplophysa dalaica]